jgi:hypothetical protein
MPPRNPALARMDDAFARLRADVTKADAQNFDATLLVDVKNAAKGIEQLAKNRNLGRLRPLLDGLGQYSGVVEVLCNGTPYLPWIWVSSRIRSTRSCSLMTYRLRSSSVFRSVSQAQACRNNPSLMQGYRSRSTTTMRSRSSSKPTATLEKRCQDLTG